MTTPQPAATNVYSGPYNQYPFGPSYLNQSPPRYNMFRPPSVDPLIKNERLAVEHRTRKRNERLRARREIIRAPGWKPSRNIVAKMDEAQKKLQEVCSIASLAQPDIVILTETWLKYSIKPSLNTPHVLQSPASPHQGVAILGLNNTINLQPVLTALWTPHTIAALAHIKTN